MDKEKLSIAILGTRGIPNRYGGFEAFAQKLAPWLVEQGHQVSVYCSHSQEYQDKEWKGVQLIFKNNPEDKIGTKGQFLYDVYCNLDTHKRKFDVVLHLGYTSDSVWWWLWSRKAKHITNMDGMEWMRAKYSRYVKRFLRKAEKWAIKHSNMLIADSVGVQEYLLFSRHAESTYIPYGATIPKKFDLAVLKEYKVEPQLFDLLIARMEPENNILMAIEAKLLSKVDLPLIIIANDNAFGAKLKAKYGNEKRIKIFPADYRKKALNTMRHYCRYYIHGHSVGGTNPSLLEAMACECMILAHDNGFNRGVLQEGGKYFKSKEKLAELLDYVDPVCISYLQIIDNLNNIKHNYKWKKICQAYEDACYEVL